MQCRLFLSLGACLVAVGFTQAQQPTRSPIPSTGEPRTVVPAGLAAPVNKVGEAVTLRGLAEEKSGRSIGSWLLNVRQLDAGREGRAVTFQQHTERSLNTTSSGRAATIMTLQPGDKVNKLPETAGNRHLTSESTGRATLPPAKSYPMLETTGGRRTGDR